MKEFRVGCKNGVFGDWQQLKQIKTVLCIDCGFKQTHFDSIQNIEYNCDKDRTLRVGVKVVVLILSTYVHRTAFSKLFFSQNQ